MYDSNNAGNITNVNDSSLVNSPEAQIHSAKLPSRACWTIWARIRMCGRERCGGLRVRGGQIICSVSQVRVTTSNFCRIREML